jgi:hypothetical protein
MRREICSWVVSPMAVFSAIMVIWYEINHRQMEFSQNKIDQFVVLFY